MRLASIRNSIRQSVFVALIACLVPAAGSSVARTCTSDEKAEADKKLWLNKRDATAAINRHLPWGLPESTSSNDSIQVLAQRDYVIGYDLDFGFPCGRRIA